jgi:hypothetical protein
MRPLISRRWIDFVLFAFLGRALLVHGQAAQVKLEGVETCSELSVSGWPLASFARWPTLKDKVQKI